MIEKFAGDRSGGGAAGGHHGWKRLKLQPAGEEEEKERRKKEKKRKKNEANFLFSDGPVSLFSVGQRFLFLGFHLSIGVCFFTWNCFSFNDESQLFSFGVKASSLSN